MTGWSACARWNAWRWTPITRSSPQDIVKMAHRSGYRVCCYTPNDSARVIELAGWGVDTIITDAIDQIAADSFSA